MNRRQNSRENFDIDFGTIHTHIYSYSMSVWHGLLFPNAIKRVFLFTTWNLKLNAMREMLFIFFSWKRVNFGFSSPQIAHIHTPRILCTSSFSLEAHIQPHAEIWIRWNFSYRLLWICISHWILSIRRILKYSNAKILYT